MVPTPMSERSPDMSKRKATDIRQFLSKKRQETERDNARQLEKTDCIEGTENETQVTSSTSEMILDLEVGEGPPQTSHDSDVPDCWSKEQWRGWKERNPWLYVKDGCIGCSTCRDAKTLLLSDKRAGLHLSDEWINGTVRSNSKKTLAKKIYKHRQSTSHLRAIEIADLKQKKMLPNKIMESNAHLVHETTNSFRTAYTIAKERLSFKKMTPLLKLQELNGAAVGKVHRSDHSCAEIIEHISKEMKRKVISHIKAKNSRVSITIDESTVFGIAYLIVFIRCDVTGEGHVENFFLDLVELKEGTNADSIYKALRESLDEAGLDEKFLQQNLISVASDGASVLTGQKNGVITKLKQDFPRVKSIHCLAHRLELAVHDSLKTVSGCSQFEVFIMKLYSLFHQSHKNARLLHEAADELNIQMLKIGRVFTIRWVASSFNTIKAVWKSFPALAKHFKTESEESSRPDVERKKYKGLLKHLTNSGFLSDLSCMKDVLRELQVLSLKLQKRETTLVDSSRYIEQTIEVLQALKLQVGKSSRKAEQSISSGQFKGVNITVEKEGKINRPQFIQAVIDNLKRRLPSDDFVELLKPLEMSNWPKQREQLVLFGEPEVHKLAKLLGESPRQAIDEFRDFQLQGTLKGETLKKLVTASKTHLATSAECERGFSALNDTDTKSRNRLQSKSLSSLLFVDINGPPTELFDPAPFVMSWINSGHRLSTSWLTGRQAGEREPKHMWSIF
ncbi:E3 SUMO-protein ligase KIAA1586-like [Garra rufa]|uniref:E3 SUMO-protein ligase KIAA1586-like n=1 Tax=Garra rufa TaxID=137080 RepID=UPI003CCE5AC3